MSKHWPPDGFACPDVRRPRRPATPPGPRTRLALLAAAALFGAAVAIGESLLS